MGRSRLLAASLYLCACAGPDFPKMILTEDVGEESGAGSTTTGAASSGSTGDEPIRPAPPPFVLPEGCGDGVIVAGQYDCFVPHAFEWLPSAAWPEYPNDQVSSHSYVGYDIEGDGRDELLVVRSHGELAVVRYEGNVLVLDEEIAHDGVAYGPQDRLETRWDWTGDGRADVTRLGRHGRVTMFPNLDGRGLGAEQEVHAERLGTKDNPYGVQGIAVPFDADGDGAPELLMSEVVGSPASENPHNELVQFRREGDSWVEIGERLEFLPCGWIGAYAHGDFDEDGTEDVAIVDVPQVCNGYPESPDPQWYRVGVYSNNPSLGVLRFDGWFAAGGAIQEPRMWADDIDDDGHVDLIVGIDSWPFTGLSVLGGRGDGSFEEGEPRDLTRLFPYNYPVRGRADLDGVGGQEWVVARFEGRPWAIPHAIEVEGAGPGYALNPPETEGSTSVAWLGRPIADVNGDNVDDYLVSTGTYAPVGWRGHFFMVSAP